MWKLKKRKRSISLRSPTNVDSNGPWSQKHHCQRGICFLLPFDLHWLCDVNPFEDLQAILLEASHATEFQLHKIFPCVHPVPAVLCHRALDDYARPLFYAFKFWSLLCDVWNVALQHPTRGTAQWNVARIWWTRAAGHQFELCHIVCCHLFKPRGRSKNPASHFRVWGRSWNCNSNLDESRSLWSKLAKSFRLWRKYPRQGRHWFDPEDSSGLLQMAVVPFNLDFAMSWICNYRSQSNLCNLRWPCCYGSCADHIAFQSSLCTTIALALRKMIQPYLRATSRFTRALLLHVLFPSLPFFWREVAQYRSRKEPFFGCARAVILIVTDWYHVIAALHPSSDKRTNHKPRSEESSSFVFGPSSAGERQFLEAVEMKPHRN